MWGRGLILSLTVLLLPGYALAFSGGGEVVEGAAAPADTVILRRWEAEVPIRHNLSGIPSGTAGKPESFVSDSLAAPAPADEVPYRIIHRVGFDARPGWIFKSKAPEGMYNISIPSGNSFSPHLTYSFQFDPCSIAGRTYAGAYQGIGFSWNNFADVDYLGNPFSFYLFQGARIARLGSRVAFNYEWNFGLSTPWNPYDERNNPENRTIGSKVNAYLNFNFYLSWTLSRYVDLNLGVDLTHFSNGNTAYPNAGLNLFGLKMGLVCNFNRESAYLPRRTTRTSGQYFPRHVSYDIIFFGSWRRRGVLTTINEPYMLPDSYTVLGFSFVPMYNFGHNLRAGVGLDGFYDSSANLQWEDDTCIPCGQEGKAPPLHRQMALGLSGRVDFVMPYFTIGLGVGTNVLHTGGDMKSVYQIFSLKIELFRGSFLHIGYSLHNFHEPNFLMLGFGFRLNDKSPSPYRRRQK